jgi:hypothetical protein
VALAGPVDGCCVLCDEDQLPGQWLRLAQWMNVVQDQLPGQWPGLALWMGLYEEDQLPGPMAGAGPVDGCCARKTSYLDSGMGWPCGWVLCEEVQLPGQWPWLAQWMGVALRRPATRTVAWAGLVDVRCVRKTSYLDSGLGWPSGWVLCEKDQLPGQ